MENQQITDRQINDETLGNIKENYPQKLLNAKSTALLVTIPHTKIDYEELHNKIITKKGKNLQYLITKLETHKDGDYHIHLLVKYNSQSQQRISAIHNIITSYKEDRTGNSTIDYQVPKNINATIQYLKKEETAVEGKPYLEFGTPPKETRNATKDNREILDIIKIAEQGNTEEALEQLKHADPMKYLQYKETFKSNLASENKVRKKYTPPDLSKENNKLKPQQQKVWDLLQSTPKQRRIIWVTGDYGSGKSFLYNYIKTNHEYGMYDAGQTASLDNLAYGYDEEGVIAWDLPRTFNFTELGNPIANVIEKFSDFGQSITSKKYNGKTQKVLGHAIVFSNAPPLDQLKHRDIIHIHLSTENSDNMEEEAHASPRSSKLDEQSTEQSTEYDSEGEEYISPNYQPIQEPSRIKIYNTCHSNIEKIVHNGKTTFKLIVKELGKEVIKTTNTYEEALFLNELTEY